MVVPFFPFKYCLGGQIFYDIVLYGIHVPIIVQCQCDGCCLSSEDGTVIWESLGQLAASWLTILKMAVDDRCCPHSLGLFWIYVHSYQIKESSFSQKLDYASLRDCLEEGPQWVISVVFITILLKHCTLQEHVFDSKSLATMLASCRWSSGQYMGLCGFGVAN